MPWSIVKICNIGFKKISMEVNYYVFHFCLIGAEPGIIEVDIKHVDTSSKYFQKLFAIEVNNHSITKLYCTLHRHI